MSVLKSNCLKLEVISSSEFYDFMTHINTRFTFQVLYNLKKKPKTNSSVYFFGFPWPKGLLAFVSTCVYFFYT